MAKHSEAITSHIPYSWSYADQTTREAATGFVPADVGKLSRQLDDNSLWMLTDDSPETWIQVGSSGSSTLSNSNISPTTTNVSAAVNTRYFANVSGLTANRNFVVPAGTVGDIIELNIKTGDDTYALIIIGDTGITINGGSAATEWSRLFITGESIHLVADTTSNWQVVYDGRIPCEGKMLLSAADTTNTGGAETLPTWDTKAIDQGNIGDTTNFRFNLRRAGNYQVGGTALPNGSMTDGQYYLITIKQNTTNIAGGLSRTAAAGVSITASAVTEFIGAAGDAIYLYYASQAANMGIINDHRSQFWIKEI